MPSSNGRRNPNGEARPFPADGWWWGSNEVLDRYGEQLGAYGVAVYALLARFANSEGLSFPSASTLAAKLKISEPTVRAQIKQLERLGIIRKEQRKRGENGWQSNVYQLLDGKLELPQRSTLNDTGGKPHYPPVGNQIEGSGKPHYPPVGNHVSTKKTHVEQDPLKKTHVEGSATKRTDGRDANAIAAPEREAVVTPPPPTQTQLLAEIPDQQFEGLFAPGEEQHPRFPEWKTYAIFEDCKFFDWLAEMYPGEALPESHPLVEPEGQGEPVPLSPAIDQAEREWSLGMALFNEPQVNDALYKATGEVLDANSNALKFWCRNLGRRLALGATISHESVRIAGERAIIRFNEIRAKEGRTSKKTCPTQFLVKDLLDLLDEEPGGDTGTEAAPAAPTTRRRGRNDDEQRERAGSTVEAYLAEHGMSKFG